MSDPSAMSHPPNYELCVPSPALARSYNAMRQARFDAGEDRFAPFSEEQLAEYVRSGGGDSTREFWIVKDNTVLGSFVVRQPMTPLLNDVRGNIGYGTHPAYRNSGVATFALRSALEILRASGDYVAIVTCLDDNAASAKVIENCGGVRLSDSALDAVRRRRYAFQLRPAELRGTTCLLRCSQPQDAPSIARNADSLAIWRNFRDFFPHPYTLEDADGWVARMMAQVPQTNFVIDVAGEAAGCAGFRIGNDIDRSTAEIGYWLGEAHWGRGIGTEAAALVARYAFDAIGITRVEAQSLSTNVASRRVLEKAGFTEEAVRRKAVTKNGVTLDVYLFALLRDEVM